MSVRDALPARNGAGPGAAVAPARPAGELTLNPTDESQAITIAAINEAIARQTEAFGQLLPKGTDPGRFARLVLNAVKSTPDLVKCFYTPEGRASLLFSSLQAASVGLEPNTPVQDGWLLPRKRKIKQRGKPDREVDEAEFSISYRGLLKLMRRSGDILDVKAMAVYEADVFDFEYGLHEKLVHRAAPAGERGALTHVWALAHHPNGGATWIVMDQEQVHKRRAFSKSWSSESARPYSPWTKWTEDMWCKTGARGLSKFVEMSPEAARALALDEQVVRYDPLQEQLVSDEPFEDDEPPALERERVTVQPDAVITPSEAEIPPGGPPSAAAIEPDGPTVDELIKEAVAKEVIPAGKGHGTNRAKIVRAASDWLGTEYANATELEADGGATTRYLAYLQALAAPEPGAF